MTEVVSLPHASATVDNKGVACLWIVSNNHLNILGTPVIKDLITALEHLASRKEIRVLVLRGQGDKAFVAGANIKEMAHLDRQSAERFISGLRDLCEAVRQFPAPVIARIPGWCLGGGLELAMACDIRLAAAGAQFGMPEVKVGIPSVIHAVLMPALIGPTQATWMLLSGELVGTEQALAWGLVTEVVQPEALDDRLAQMSELFAGLAPAALTQQKRLLRRWEKLSTTDAINDTVAEFGKAFETGEPRHYMGQWMKDNT
ncbi:enoyl-CoA hydratase [Orrella marina]|uniref:Enoyl-CoA hydratase n=1 Tax=Orrella marina TaxID=2163011 RepID=A0A2R4XQ64_9BURK|nr:enoyl-CoA hydratase [Orrella marina]AWB35925.1 enoyl-CoA hydratase [Orrella marina]